MIQTQTHKGFTLIEVLTTIAIIGVLASIVIVVVSNAREKADTAEAQAHIDGLTKAIQQLAIDTGEWPGHQPADQDAAGVAGNEIADLSCADCGLLADDPVTPYTGWRGPYLDEIPLDPWGHSYYFDTDWDINHGIGPQKWAVVIGSAGPNGTGPQYNSDDIFKVLWLDND